MTNLQLPSSEIRQNYIQLNDNTYNSLSSPDLNVNSMRTDLDLASSSLVAHYLLSDPPPPNVPGTSSSSSSTTKTISNISNSNNCSMDTNRNTLETPAAAVSSTSDDVTNNNEDAKDCNTRADNNVEIATVAHCHNANSLEDFDMQAQRVTLNHSLEGGTQKEITRARKNSIGDRIITNYTAVSHAKRSLLTEFDHAAPSQQHDQPLSAAFGQQKPNQNRTQPDADKMEHDNKQTTVCGHVHDLRRPCPTGSDHEHSGAQRDRCPPNDGARACQQENTLTAHSKYQADVPRQEHCQQHHEPATDEHRAISPMCIDVEAECGTHQENSSLRDEINDASESSNTESDYSVVKSKNKLNKHNGSLVSNFNIDESNENTPRCDATKGDDNVIDVNSMNSSTDSTGFDTKPTEEDATGSVGKVNHILQTQTEDHNYFRKENGACGGSKASSHEAQDTDSDILTLTTNSHVASAPSANAFTENPRPVATPQYIVAASKIKSASQTSPSSILGNNYELKDTHTECRTSPVEESCDRNKSENIVDCDDKASTEREKETGMPKAVNSILCVSGQSQNTSPQIAVEDPALSEGSTVTGAAKISTSTSTIQLITKPAPLSTISSVLIPVFVQTSFKKGETPSFQQAFFVNPSKEPGNILTSTSSIATTNAPRKLMPIAPKLNSGTHKPVFSPTNTLVKLDSTDGKYTVLKCNNQISKSPNVGHIRIPGHFTTASSTSNILQINKIGPKGDKVQNKSNSPPLQSKFQSGNNFERSDTSDSIGLGSSCTTRTENDICCEQKLFNRKVSESGSEGPIAVSNQKTDIDSSPETTRIADNKINDKLNSDGLDCGIPMTNQDGQPKYSQVFSLSDEVTRGDGNRQSPENYCTLNNFKHLNISPRLDNVIIEPKSDSRPAVGNAHGNSLRGQAISTLTVPSTRLVLFGRQICQGNHVPRSWSIKNQSPGSNHWIRESETPPTTNADKSKSSVDEPGQNAKLQDHDQLPYERRGCENREVNSEGSFTESHTDHVGFKQRQSSSASLKPNYMSRCGQSYDALGACEQFVSETILESPPEPAISVNMAMTKSFNHPRNAGDSRSKNDTSKNRTESSRAKHTNFKVFDGSPAETTQLQPPFFLKSQDTSNKFSSMSAPRKRAYTISGSDATQHIPLSEQRTCTLNREDSFASYTSRHNTACSSTMPEPTGAMQDDILTTALKCTGPIDRDYLLARRRCATFSAQRSAAPRCETVGIVNNINCNQNGASRICARSSSFGDVEFSDSKPFLNNSESHGLKNYPTAPEGFSNEDNCDEECPSNAKRDRYDTSKDEYRFIAASSTSQFPLGSHFSSLHRYPKCTDLSSHIEPSLEDTYRASRSNVFGNRREMLSTPASEFRRDKAMGPNEDSTCLIQHKHTGQKADKYSALQDKWLFRRETGKDELSHRSDDDSHSQKQSSSPYERQRFHSSPYLTAVKRSGGTDRSSLHQECQNLSPPRSHLIPEAHQPLNLCLSSATTDSRTKEDNCDMSSPKPLNLTTRDRTESSDFSAKSFISGAHFQQHRHQLSFPCEAAGNFPLRHDSPPTHECLQAQPCQDNSPVWGNHPDGTDTSLSVDAHSANASGYPTIRGRSFSMTSRMSSLRLDQSEFSTVSQVDPGRCSVPGSYSVRPHHEADEEMVWRPWSARLC